jgi:hypothetical protein
VFTNGSVNTTALARTKWGVGASAKRVPLLFA